ncbi:MAG: hypothetical protein RMK84_06640 [Oscillochloridaceae bacterium]|nr:hypothetical protein [Chloroflexaceae bacterium]MDW8389786.1 hypothetical protein [Oscillochloridaceae bacterium]
MRFSWPKSFLALFLFLAGGVGALYLYGALRWQRAIGALHAKMYAARLPAGVRPYDPRDLADLPVPVQRYFRTVLKEGQPVVASARVKFTGVFNMSQTAEQWRPLTSTQHVVTRHPGFVWDARIGMAPGMPIYVYDAYVAGTGALAARLLGLFTVAEMPASPELNHGELMRFLAEAVWYPTALLPGQGVEWEAIDDTRAAATLRDGATSVRLVFQFDAQGLIDSVRADDRYRDVNGTLVPTPWQVRCWDFQARDGMLVPLQGEVAWLLPQGPHPYWRGRIERVEYHYQ